MTNRQSKTNPISPRTAFLVLGQLLGGLAALGVSVWFIVTVDGSWDAVCAVAWAYIGKSLVDGGVRNVLLIGRADQARAAQARAAQEADNTGVWKAEGAGSFTVRFDEARSSYWVCGWISEHYSVPFEIEWTDVPALVETIQQAEEEGMVPEDDQATRGIRARLNVKGWDEFLAGHADDL